jgi:RNA polymerase sigma-70 factor (ECF subfamily)
MKNKNRSMTENEFVSTVYNKYYKDIYNMVIRITGSKTDSEDITQDAFIKAFKNISNFKGASKLSTWIFSIARNETFQFLKKSKKRDASDIEKLIEEANQTKNEMNLSDEEQQHLVTQVKEGCLTGLLQCLSTYQRSAFVINVLFNFATAETALILGKSEGATKGLVFRARKNIREFLCKNCSLYKISNHCKCENLISFSLNQGWIKKPSGKHLRKKLNLDISSISSEIADYKKIVQMYTSLPAHDPSNKLEKTLHDKLKKLRTEYVIKKRN